MLEELKRQVYEANMLLPKHGLVTFTWGKDANESVHNAVVLYRITGFLWRRMSGACGRIF